MAVLFISDLHIDAHRPEIAAHFIEFLRGQARGADALYILGDLFESWVGDDAADAGQSAAIAEIKSLTASGVPCFVMHGNRDFLLGAQFCEAAGAQLLPDPLIMTLYGEPVLVMHGDALCTDDRAYQRLRATVRDAAWQREFLALSVAARRALAGAARVGSQAHTASMEQAITDVNAESVAAALRAAGTATLLHGHTHRPGIQPLYIDGRACTRIVLGDWYTHGSLLRWDSSGPELVSLPRATPIPAGSPNESERVHRGS
jgi:UDP-2,3-diacylglucosamine hydrolase